MNEPQSINQLGLAIGLVAGILGFISSAVLWGHARKADLQVVPRTWSGLWSWSTFFFAGVSLLLSQFSLGKHSLIPLPNLGPDGHLVLFVSTPLQVWLLLCMAGAVFTCATTVVRREKRLQDCREASRKSAHLRFYQLPMLLLVVLVVWACNSWTPRPSSSVLQEWSVYQRVGAEYVALTAASPTTQPAFSLPESLARAQLIAAWKSRLDARGSQNLSAGDAAELAKYRAIAQDYLLFTDQDPANDPRFSAVEAARAARTIETWRIRLQEERKGVPYE